jgi:hypothetical protein
LLDSKWKENRNRHLLSKMLDLEQPSITVKVWNEIIDLLVNSLIYKTQIDGRLPVARRSL